MCAQAQREGSETQSKQRGCTKSLSLERHPVRACTDLVLWFTCGAVSSPSC